MDPPKPTQRSSLLQTNLLSFLQTQSTWRKKKTVLTWKVHPADRPHVKRRQNPCNVHQYKYTCIHQPRIMNHLQSETTFCTWKPDQQGQRCQSRHLAHTLDSLYGEFYGAEIHDTMKYMNNHKCCLRNIVTYSGPIIYKTPLRKGYGCQWLISEMKLCCFVTVTNDNFIVLFFGFFLHKEGNFILKKNCNCRIHYHCHYHHHLKVNKYLQLFPNLSMNNPDIINSAAVL